jgi:hypothetical protein
MFLNHFRRLNDYIGSQPRDMEIEQASFKHELLDAHAIIPNQRLNFN